MNNQVTTAQTAVLVLEDGSIWHGIGHGVNGMITGEVCFNTAMTGYQEILTDPSYTGQFVVFTFPHVGNCGTNPQDIEQGRPETADLPASGAVGAIFREAPTPPSNWRAEGSFSDWLVAQKRLAISGLDTRALTAHIRTHGMQNGALYVTDGVVGEADIAAATLAVQDAPEMDGRDLASDVSIKSVTPYASNEALPKVAVIDFGIKSNIVSLLHENELGTTLFPANITAAEVLATTPQGIVFSNGPGDPQATLEAAGQMIKDLLASGLPVLGICLGHQLLALALGAKTQKMVQGHHGANHPIKNLESGVVEIVSMNHGYVVDEANLSENMSVSYRSLFDGTISGLKIKDRPIISVQHHPEASPGPQEGRIVFQEFADLVRRFQAS